MALSTKLQGVLTIRGDETRCCDVEELCSDGTNTDGEGNNARDEVYNDEKVEAGSEVSQKSNSLRKVD